MAQRIWFLKPISAVSRSITPLIVDQLYRGVRQGVPARANKKDAIVRLASTENERSWKDLKP